MARDLPISRPRSYTGNTLLMRNHIQPTKGTRFLNIDDNIEYEWDGFKWIGAPVTGKYPKTPEVRVAYTASGMGGGSVTGAPGTGVNNPPNKPGPGGQHPVNPTAKDFLLAFVVKPTIHSVAPPTDDSDHPWTLLSWSGDFCNPQTVFSGAGPPTDQGCGIYARAIVPGESASVATFDMAADSGGVFVFEIGGCTLAGLQAVVTRQAHLADGGTNTNTGMAGSRSVLFGGSVFGKVNYDDGWCAASSSNWGGQNLVKQHLGTEVINAAADGTCGLSGSSPTPWLWLAYAVGTGALDLACIANSLGGGAGAYVGGYNTSLQAVLIPNPGVFAIVQQANAYSIVGGPVTVTLPGPPS